MDLEILNFGFEIAYGLGKEYLLRVFNAKSLRGVSFSYWLNNILVYEAHFLIASCLFILN